MNRIFKYILTSSLLFPAIANAAAFSSLISGYVDGSYNYLLRSNQFTSHVYDRFFDIEPNGFTLQQAGLRISSLPPQGFGGHLHVIIGRDANATADYGWNPYFGSQTLAMDPIQAYLQYAINKFTFVIGKMPTVAGAEAIDPTLDTNFSRSMLFSNVNNGMILGVRSKYAVNEQFYVLAGINNGWYSIGDISRRKTIELGIGYKPNTRFNMTTQVYSGGERAVDNANSGPESIRNLFDVVASYTVNDKLNLVVNYAFASQAKAAITSTYLSNAVWQGLAGYANYQVAEKLLGSLRGEIFSDRNGYRTGVAQCIKAITLTMAYSFNKAFMLRGEVRHDLSNNSAFLTSNKLGSNNNQQSYALEGMYRF